jgi:two-component system sensor histidine kinase HydH
MTYLRQFIGLELPELGRKRVGQRIAEKNAVPDQTTFRWDVPSYSFPMAASEQHWIERPQVGVFLIAAMLTSIAVLTFVIPATDVSTHNVLHHLNFLPLMIAGMLFGLRGAVYTSLFAFAVDAPVIVRHWYTWPLDAKDQVVELMIFSLAGLVAGYLSDRERSQRRSLEHTREELERVYLELRENISKMKKAERLSAAGQLAASLAHEIRNPLASISGAAGILQRKTANPEYQHDSLEIIQIESQRLNKLLTGFLNFAKPRSPRLQRTNLNELMLSVLSLVSHAAELNGNTFSHTPLPTGSEIDCDPEQLKQVLLNLMINAIEASPAGSEIRLRTAIRDGVCAIEIEDDGSGIPADAADRIFDPFFTTKPKGTGLGLAISSMIVSQHGGTLSFQAGPRGGAIFRIELPANQEAAHAQ